MNLQLFHQLGHNWDWNISAHYHDSAGDGFILAPRHMPKETIEEYTPAFTGKCLFDPQFFKPHIPLGKLAEYDFFPEVLAPGADTKKFTKEFAGDAAGKCVGWQVAREFPWIVIPNYCEEGAPSNFFAKQEELFVKPFTEAAHGCGKPLMLQLVVNKYMLMEDSFRTELLNWITGLQAITGVYLIVEIDQRSKQLQEIGVLSRLLRFVDSLRTNGLEVIIGYTNAEALLLSAASPSGVTMGSYERTRIFHSRNFVEGKKQEGGPAARLYMSQLLQWVRSDYVDVIEQKFPGAESLFDVTPHHAEMFVPTYEWHFSKPPLYRHYFVIFAQQIAALRSVEGKERYKLLKSMLLHARATEQKLTERGIVLDTDSTPSHIGPWLTVLYDFADQKGWN